MFYAKAALKSHLILLSTFILHFSINLLNRNVHISQSGRFIKYIKNIFEVTLMSFLLEWKWWLENIHLLILLELSGDEKLILNAILPLVVQIITRSSPNTSLQFALKNLLWINLICTPTFGLSGFKWTCPCRRIWSPISIR